MPTENNLSLARKLSANTIAQFAGKGVSSFFSLITTFLLTHYALVGHSGFGIYVFALTFTAIFGTFTDWGLSLVVIKEASKDETSQAKIVGNGVLIRFFLSVIAALTAILIVDFFAGSDQLTRTITTLAAINLILLTLKTSFQSVFNIKLKMINWSISESVNNLLILFFVAVAIFLNRSLTEIVCGILFANFLGMVFTFFLSQRLMKINFGLNSKIIKKILFTALPMGTVMGVLILYNRLDMIILSQLKGSDAVADYGLAYRVFDVIFVLGSFFVNTTLPVIASMIEKDRNQLSIFWSQCTSAILIMGSFFCVGTMLFSPFAVGLIGGQSFLGAVFPLQILSFSFIVSFLNVLNGYLFLSLGRQWTWFKIALLALFFNLIVNLISIPIFSLEAAAFNTVLTETLILLVSWRSLNKEMGSPFKSANPLKMFKDNVLNFEKMKSLFLK